MGAGLRGLIAGKRCKEEGDDPPQPRVLLLSSKDWPNEKHKATVMASY